MNCHLDALMADQHKRLRPWEPKRKRAAIAACIGALPMAKNADAVDFVLKVLLRVHGGGKVAGYSFTFSENGYSAGRHDKQLPLETTMRELKKLMLDEE